MVEEIQSEESDDDDSSSEEETPIKTNPPNRDSRFVSLKFPFEAPGLCGSRVLSICVAFILKMSGSQREESQAPIFFPFIIKLQPKFISNHSNLFHKHFQ